MVPLRTFAKYLLAMGIVLLGLSAATQFAQGMDYAGASDTSAVQRGLALYGGYLRTLAVHLGALLAIEIFGLASLTSGLLVLGGSLFLGRWRLVRLVLLSTVVAIAFLGAQAHRYPGLFLTLVSSGSLGVAWVYVGRIAWVALLLCSAVGFGAAAFRTNRKLQRAFCVSAGGTILVSMAWMAGWRGDRVVPAKVAMDSAVHAASSAQGNASQPAGPVGARPNVLLIAVDSLRPDKIDPSTTPTIARLLDQSVYFPNALVTLPRTGPSWVALLTSLPPLDNGIETMFPGQGRSELSTLAMPAHLGSLGYATGIFSEYAGEFFTRVRVGFDETAVPQVELRQMLGQALLARQPLALALAAQLYTSGPVVRGRLPASLRELLRGTAAFAHPSVLEEDLANWITKIGASGGEPPDRDTPASSRVSAMGRRAAADGSTTSLGHPPWFAVVFYSQPHFPYTSSSPFYDSHAVAGSDPSLRFGKDVLRGEVRSSADRDQVDALYRGALAESDAALAQLLRRLEGMGELSDTLIILTADHGEGLYECRRCAGHGDNLNGLSTLRVPLAFRLPKARFGTKAAVVDTFVSQLDMYPTLLSLLGIPVPPTHQGEPLLDAQGAAMQAARAGEPRTFFAETGEWLWPSVAVPEDRIAYPPITQIGILEEDRIAIAEPYMPVIRAAKHRMAIRPPFALVYEPKHGSVTVRLCDLRVDPFAEGDVSERHPDVRAQLHEALRRSVLRSASMLEVDGFFLTRPPMPPEEYW